MPRYHAANRPDSVAVVDGDRVTTYGAWDERCSRVANGLIGLGLKPGSRVAALDQNSDRYFEILFGTAKMGGVLVSVNWRLAPPEIAYILNDCGADVIFIGERFAGLLKSVLADLKKDIKVIVTDGAAEGWPNYDQWLAQQSAADTGYRGNPADTIVQMYTSGTTGHPKGVQLSHYSFYAHDRSRAIMKDQYDPQLLWNDWDAKDVSLVTMPAFHISGTGWGVVGYYNGARNIILTQFEPGEVLETIRRDRVSKLVLVPAAIQQLLQHPKCRETDFSSIKYLLYGASPIPLDLLREAVEVFQCGFIQLYGMTETAGAVTYLPAEDHSFSGNTRMRSAGRAVTGARIEVRDSEGRTLAPGMEGEIWIHSPTRMNGYWNLAEATAATLTDDGWVRTGDAGYMDEDGYVYVQDRVKDMIVSGGENIYPAEVESAIYGHPSVAEIAVIAVPDDKWGEAVKAVIVLKPGSKPDANAIIDFARTRIAGYKVPKSIDFVEALPRNGTGKVLKRELRKPYWEGRDRQVN
ncbi:MAG: long-chain-fatty-acid--CoA ligase [Alphaproteobacteria bacterium]|nr:long-chain-fatty-acid--CoA ligase [Alphaproteobacteria bacterium]